MNQIEGLLSGGDRRSIGNSNLIAANIRNQKGFDQLFKLLFHTERIIRMRAADAIEKITIDNPSFLAKHKKEIFGLCTIASDKEMKWHLALLLLRLPLQKDERKKAWDILSQWAMDKSQSRIVRVNSLQSMFNLLKVEPHLKEIFDLIVYEVHKEKIPSIEARIKQFYK